MKTGLLLIMLLIAQADIEAAPLPKTCKILTAEKRKTLTDYVRGKFKVPQTLDLQLAGADAVLPSCHWKLTFVSANKERSSSRLELFLSPDGQYLSRELLDTSVDPVKEEREKAKKLATQLSGGMFPVLGGAGAPVTITVFSDFQCPYCAKFAKMLRDHVIPQQRQNVRVVFRHLPLKMHSWGRLAAQTTACVHRQSNDAFWRLHDLIFEKQEELTPDNFHAKVTELVRQVPGVNYEKFQGCLLRKESDKAVEDDIAFAETQSINATPTVFINTRQVPLVSVEQILSVIRESAATKSAALK